MTDQSLITSLFEIAILVMSVVIHEVSHGFTAYALGDSTAKYAGRLTLNPIPHIDPFGSIFLPLVMALLPGGLVFGYAKPVPYNPYNLRNQKWGPALVALAGPVSNIFIALVFGLVIRFQSLLPFMVPAAFLELSFYIITLNLVLAVFNLVPIPPLDGSKVLFMFLPYHMGHIQRFLEQYGFFLLLIFIFFFFKLLFPIIGILFYVFTGVSL